ncbi:twin-arginine translocase subunit TatC [Stakelama sediminis]|uniref:Sec-independent protein translocase protein TatC n=1 Tax=Stakelama sediminis TaxID=463200 RepID=A0A840Z004_9SPHN|nr:twin-arginine translocase subunit TatC [Stakelama sediminis]MBB5719421.1 sec-independent protein translocase protein TatC [Stakelama sediminis]
MSDDNEIDDSKAPLLEHLIELRRRLLFSVLTVVAAFIICYFFAEEIFAFLVQPLVHAGQKRIIFTQIFEAFFVRVKVAFFAGLMVSFPIIANQLWKFVAPGLYRKEKRALLPFLFATPILFLLGAAMAYFVAVPLSLKFLLSYQGNMGGIEQDALPSVGNYLSFVMQFLFAFGLAFLLPIFMMLVERAGLVTRAQFVSARRYAIVGIFAVSAILTPPDIGSQFLLAVPLILLYELGMIGIWFTEKKRREASDASAA